MKSIALMVLLVFLLLGAFASPILDGVKGWRTNDTTEAFASVATGSGETSANVTLGSDLFQDKTSEVISITSNETGESPVATNYTTSTRVLLVSALSPSTTRTLTINYYAETDNTVMAALGPFLGVLIIGGLLAGIVYQGIKRR